MNGKLWESEERDLSNLRNIKRSAEFSNYLIGSESPSWLLPYIWLLTIHKCNIHFGLYERGFQPPRGNLVISHQKLLNSFANLVLSVLSLFSNGKCWCLIIMLKIHYLFQGSSNEIHTLIISSLYCHYIVAPRIEFSHDMNVKVWESETRDLSNSRNIKRWLQFSFFSIGRESPSTTIVWG